MYLVKGKIIDTSIAELLDLLKQELVYRHIDKLRDMFNQGEDMAITCPIHKHGHENRPSCGVLLMDKGEVPAGTVNCFTCGYKAGFTKFVSDCLEVPYSEAEDWVLSVASFSLSKRSREVEILSLEDYSAEPEKVLKELNIDLKQYDYIHPYMFKRKLTEEVISRFHIGYDPKTNSLTFPVFNEGKLVFIVRRNVDHKYFNMPKLNPKPIWGLDDVKDSEEVIVCESVINALTCYVYGKQAIALLGTGTSDQLEKLKSLKARKLILALDGDEAGRRGTRKILNSLRDLKLVSVMEIPEGKDVNDLTKGEFDRIYNRAL